MTATKRQADAAADLRKVGRDLKSVTARRDQLVREAIATGMSLREVAEHVGMSHQGVALIVERGK